MRRIAWATGSLVALLLLTAPACDQGAAPSETGSTPADDTACGIVACGVDEGAPDDYDVDQVVVDVEGGKADAADKVLLKLQEVTADGELSAADVDALWDEAGKKKSVGELNVIREAVDPALATYEVTAEATARAEDLGRIANIADEDEVATLLSGESFAGTQIPAAVAQVVANARLRGAVAYDVTEVDDDGETVWTHYPSVSPAVGNMAFDYTEITPQVLADDVADTDVVYNAIIGTETLTTSWGQEYQAAKYEQRKGGTGNILAQYDEVYHPDLYARGTQGQKWANNFAILSDGTIHCLPAARRDINQRLILTNPALARGKRLLFNGHLDVRGGEVMGVELSGRLSKLAAKGKARFIDPIALLEAWGFDIMPGLSVRWGNTSAGTPTIHDGVITSAPDAH